MAELGVWTIPGYVVHERLEAGLVSAAYLASRTSDGYPVLLQVVSEEFSDPVSAERFRATMEQVAAVRHPVIPSLREVGEADGLLYTISNAVEGRSLDATLQSQGTLPLDDTLAVCVELADALDMLATAGVVHAAVSPTTVWINDRVRSPSAPYVSLRGFGTTPLRSHRIDTDTDAPPPPDVLYTAPEQVYGSTVEQTDQYALACMVLHCLTGTAPFVRATTRALFDAHADHEPDDDLLRADRLPPRVVAGLRRALAKDPADRFPTCTAFATAIGGITRPSWTWMIEEGHLPGETATRGTATRETATRETATRQIDIRDEVIAGQHAGPTAPDTSARRSQQPDDRGSPAARSLAEVDWLPGSATRTGPQQPIRPPPASAPRARRSTPRSTAAPTRRRRRRLSADLRRWIGLTLLVGIVAVAAVAFGRALLTADDTAPTPTIGDQATGEGAREIAATWRKPVTDDLVGLLVATDDEVLSVAGTTVDSLDPATGRSRWRAGVGATVRDLSVLGPTVIVRTSSEFVGLDRTGGDVRWRSSEAGTPDLEAFVTGRGRMFGVGRDDDGGVVAHAIDPRTGEVGWSIPTPARGERDPGAPVLIAFDGSDARLRSLYVGDGDQLYAFDVTTRDLRWRTDLSHPQPSSLTALAGAVLVVGGDGEVCRLHARDGDQAWTACARLQRADAPAAIVQVRDGRVVVASAHEVVSIAFTSGLPQWRIVSQQSLQSVVAANRAATFVAAPDGTIEAIAQRNGASLWESAPFGSISAMTANEEAVFLTTTDGRLTRLEAPTAAADAG